LLSRVLIHLIDFFNMKENTYRLVLVDELVFRNGGGIDRDCCCVDWSISIIIGCGLDNEGLTSIGISVPNDCSCSSVEFDIIFDDNPILVWHEPVDRKNPLKKKLFEVWLSSRCLSRSKAQRWQAGT
jgi:hypothetical protein